MFYYSIMRELSHHKETLSVLRLQLSFKAASRFNPKNAPDGWGDRARTEAARASDGILSRPGIPLDVCALDPCPRSTCPQAATRRKNNHFTSVMVFL